MNTLKVGKTTVEYLENPAGIDILQPRLSWIINAEGRRSVYQSAYHIIAASTIDLMEQNQGDLWDTGRIDSEDSQHIKYTGLKLQSEQKIYWKVRIWDDQNNVSDWSEIASWSMGLLSRHEWEGFWIGLKCGLKPTREKPNPVIYLRRRFEIGQKIKRATVYSTALGVYRLHLNDNKLGKALFSPEWTDYHTRTQYQTYDITESLKQGENVFSVMLGQGWYAGYLGMYGFQKYGMEPSFFLQCNIEFEDGSKMSVSSDQYWLASFGPIISSDMQMGEIYDARLEMPGWKSTNFLEAGWKQVDRMYDYRGSLVSQLVPPIATTHERTVNKVAVLADGKTLVDVGQNLTGWLRLSVRKKCGTVITLRYGEALDEEGKLYTDNLRLALQTDVFISGDVEEELFETTFTCHGFQYVEISGLTSPITEMDITCVVVYSDLPETGELLTSHQLVNKLVENIRWSQRNNYMGVPTDCPQRDERHGWTGDAQIFARTAAYNMNISSFMTKWMTDLTDGQQTTGAYSDFAPFVFGPKTAYDNDFTYTHLASAGWADAPLIIGWMLYEVYGDMQVLRNHYHSMKRWMEYNERLYPLGIRRDAPQYGDWLSVHERPIEQLKEQYDWLVEENSTTPYDVFSTMYWAYDAKLMTQIADVLGEVEDSTYYRELYHFISKAFINEFVRSDGYIKGDTQTVYAMSLDFELLDHTLQQKALSRLIHKLESSGRMATTGFHGTRSLMRVLSKYGYEAIAFDLLLREEYPSWLYSVLQGASTIWERWDGWTVEKGFQNPGMNSLCHYAFGSVGEWMYENLGGISLDSSSQGFKVARIRPRPFGGLTYTTCSYTTLYGTIRTEWKLEGNKFQLKLDVPVNTKAYVHIPVAHNTSVMESGQLASEVEGISRQGYAEGSTEVFLVGSGHYVFESIT